MPKPPQGREGAVILFLLCGYEGGLAGIIQGLVIHVPSDDGSQVVHGLVDTVFALALVAR